MEIVQSELPETFLVMSVDTKLFTCKVGNRTVNHCAMPA